MTVAASHADELYDPFYNLKWFAKEWGCSVHTLSRVSLQQRGQLKKARKLSDRALASYPTFILGPGLHPGMWRSEYLAWQDAHKEHPSYRRRGRGVDAILPQRRRA